MLKKIFLLSFYFILYFSIFLQFEFKKIIWFCIIIPFYITLVIQIFAKEKYIFSYIVIIICFFLSNTLTFSNFFLDLIFQPEIPALDCSGALPMNGNWIRGYVFGLLTSIVMIRIYLTKIKNVFLNIEKILSLILVILLTISIIFPDTFYKLYVHIIDVSRPIVIFPEDC